MLKLYDYPQCPFSQKTRIVLAEKQLDYEKIIVDLRKREQFDPSFLALNPFHKVPVLVEEEEGEENPTVIYDSTVIDEYLEDEYPEPALLPPPGDSAARSRIRQLEDYADIAFVLPAGNLLTEHVKREEERDVERLRRAKEEVDRAFLLLERELQGGRQFLGGDQFTLADAAFAPRLLLLMSRNVELPEGTRALRGYIDRLRQRESVRRLDGI
ncbi:MAG: glutathione S-transferase family protein [Deltaproteobacteria bacterium]|nr:glutathione S-transferase family protein [Deltaproteobacteria bacterium]